MHTYLIILKEETTLNKEVLRYFAKMDFTILDYYPNLNILKISCPKVLEKKKLKYIDSFEKEKHLNL